MKQLLNLLMLPLYMAMLAACGQANPDLPRDSSTSTSIQSDADSTPKESTDTAALPHEDPSPINTTQEEPPMNATKKIRFLADSQEIIVVLEDHAAADALYQQLPMELSFEDFNSTEKLPIWTRNCPPTMYLPAVIPMQAICAIISPGATSAFSIRISEHQLP